MFIPIELSMAESITAGFSRGVAGLERSHGGMWLELLKCLEGMEVGVGVVEKGTAIVVIAGQRPADCARSGWGKVSPAQMFLSPLVTFTYTSLTRLSTSFTMKTSSLSVCFGSTALSEWCANAALILEQPEPSQIIHRLWTRKKQQYI